MNWKVVLLGLFLVGPVLAEGPPLKQVSCRDSFPHGVSSSGKVLECFCCTVADRTNAPVLIKCFDKLPTGFTCETLAREVNFK